jgi:Astacin (Peptidase family M12A)
LQDLDEQDPEITPGLFEGDQAIDNELYSYFRVGLRWDVFPEKLWPNRTIPYAISPLYEPEDMITILTAIRTLNTMTCLKFVKWNGKVDDFLLIWPIKYPRVRKLSSAVLMNSHREHSAGLLVLRGQSRRPANPFAPAT